MFMRKFNLFNEIIIVNKSKLLEAINSQKIFGIKINGEIAYEPFDNKDILIYQGKHTPGQTNALMPATKPTLESILGKNYQVVEDDDRVLIKAFSNWQEIIGWNSPRASYNDTTADGVDEFATKDMEDIGWHATEFDIKYRELVEELEEKCDGTLVCIEQEEPYQFSGLGFLNNDEDARKVLYEYCREKIQKLLDEGTLHSKDNLTDDEAEAAEFFGIKIND
jgi:hypothetical protein